MNLEELREARLRNPFQPFSIRLTDGRMFPVNQPESVAVGRKFALVLTKGDSVVKLDPPLIESIDTPSKNGKGESGKRQPRKA
jgi:hypothetical protein